MHLKLITLYLLCRMIAMWLQMVYLTALKDYKSIFVSYFAGAAISIVLTWLNLQYGFMAPVEGTMLSMCIGVGILDLCFMVQIVRYFGYPSHAMNFEFLPYFEQHYKLFLLIIFYTLSIYVANFIVWNSSWGVMVAGTYLYSPRYDVITFYAFLSILPIMIMFVVSMELNFMSNMPYILPILRKKVILKRWMIPGKICFIPYGQSLRISWSSSWYFL